MRFNRLRCRLLDPLGHTVAGFREMEVAMAYFSKRDENTAFREIPDDRRKEIIDRSVARTNQPPSRAALLPCFRHPSILVARPVFGSCSVPF
eukprot:SAG22_NODE_897_length_6629_cov_4.853446_8_plen_92_part_00